MAQIKHLDRSAGPVTLAFCPERTPGPSLLACGTVAGAVDVNFSTSSMLEIVALDWASAVESPPVLGSVQAPERFNRLAWGQRLSGDATFPSMGLLAGGLADGSVCLWDPSIITARGGAEGRTPLLAKMQKHTGAVKGLEFNTFSPNLLASGAADSDLCIWDLAKPATPSLYPALKGASGSPGNEFTHISWNHKVQHILASCASNGTTVVWDLKKQKPVISFRDPNSQRRASVLQWNPEVATQLVVASDDDRSPTLQMWDLRNSTTPLKEFVGHQKGVLGMAWSAHDPSLLLSCGKDSRNICWDVHAADIVCELPSSHSWNFDIEWAPHSRGVFATACYDGKVELHNINACTVSKMVETVNADFSVTRSLAGDSTPLKRVPVWMKRPCCATFGFGGKLVSVLNHKVSSTDASGQALQRETATISIKQVVTEIELVQRSEQFEQAIAGGEKPTLQSYCSSKAEATGPVDPDEAETWSFLALLFESDGRRELLKKLGFQDVMTRHESLAQSQPIPDANGGDVLAGKDGSIHANGNAVASNADDFFGGQEDDPDFFDKLPDEGIQAASPIASPTANMPTKDSDVLSHRASHIGDGLLETSQELEDDIQRAMIAGNYESAVESCFKAHRLADALLIANIFNSDLFKRTMHRYMKLCPKPYMTILRANVDGDWEALVRTRPVGQWRETLALLVTYTAQEDWLKQCEVLAGRLASAGMHHAALLCHICAGNLDGAVAYWARTTGSAAHIDRLQMVIEKSVIMGLATGSSKGSAALSDLVTSYAGLLAAQGRLSTAFEYLDYAPGEASSTVAVLRDRIYRSGAAPSAHRGMAPPFPFVMEDVKAAPIARPTPAATHTQAQAGYHNPVADQHGYDYGHKNAYGTAVAAQANPYSAAQPTASVPAQSAYRAAAAQPAQHYSQYATQPSTNYNPYAAAQSQPAMPEQSNYGYGAQYTPTHAASQFAPVQTQSQFAPVQSTSQFAPVQTREGQHIGYQQQHVSQAMAAPQTAPPGVVAMDQTAVGQGQVYQAKRPSGLATQPTQPPTPTANAYAAPIAVPAASTSTSYSSPWDNNATAFGTAAGAGSGFTSPPAVAAAAPARAAPPAPPPGPPANISIASADTSKVPADQRAIVTSLTQLYNSCLPLATNPAKKREMDDNTKKVGQLFWRLNQGEVSEGVVPKLLQLCQAIDTADWHAANHIQVQMTTTDWEECGFWLSAVKRLIKMRQMVVG